MIVGVTKKYIRIVCCLLGGTLFLYYIVFWGTAEKVEFSAVTQSIRTQEKSYYIGFVDIDAPRVFEENILTGRFPDIMLDTQSTRVFEKTMAPLARIRSTKNIDEIQRMIGQYEPAYIEEVPLMEAFSTSDSLVSQQRHMQDIIDITTCKTNNAKKLAIVDTHFDNMHEDLDMQLYYVTEPGEGAHGTHVASVAAGVTNNAIGIASVSQGMQILAIDVSENDATLSYGLEGMLLAVSLGAEVINISWGSYTQTSQAYSDFFDQTQDVIFVAAAGNDSEKPTAFPASHDKVLSVGALQQEGVFANMYNSGDLCAPGIELLVADKDSGYTHTSGTSLSAAYISGLMAAGLDLSKYIKKTEDGACIYIDLSECK